MSDKNDSWLAGIGVNVSAILGSVQGATTAVADGVQGAASSVYDTASSAASGVANAAGSVYDATSSAASSAYDAASSAATSASGAAAGAYDAASGAVSGAYGAAAGAVSGAAEAVQGAASSAVQGVANAASGAGQAVSDVAAAASGAIGGVLGGIKKAVEGVDLPYQFGGIQQPIMKQLEEAAAGGNKVAPRGLTSAELKEAKVIFGDSLDYSKVVVDGGAVESLGASRTIGNTVHLTPDLFVPGGPETTTQGRRILVHELTHVWQYQHQGWTYAPKALSAQAKAAAKGSRNDAYKWEPLAQQRVPFEKWNPEQQAECVEDYNKALQKVNAGTATAEDYATLDLAAPYVRQLAAVPANKSNNPDPVDQIFNSAADMSANISVETDGSWSYTWNWTYRGTKIVTGADVHEEILFTNEKGLILDAIKEAGHGVKIGETYLGSGSGKGKIPGGKLVWKLNVLYKDGYVGTTGGSLFAMVALPI